MAPINLILYEPQTDEGKELLARRVAEVHANAVNQRIKALRCPLSQKLKLAEEVIKTVKKRCGETER